MAFHMQSAMVGGDLDSFVDWNGTVDKHNEQLVGQPVQQRPKLLPVSPVSNSHSDPYSASTKYSPHTAPFTNDLPTPTNSSPEMRNSTHVRLSGDTLREDYPIHRTTSLKRKASYEESSYSALPPTNGRPMGSKRPHNLVEKRYRANLNVKIDVLADSVPSLRALRKAKEKASNVVASSGEDEDGPTPSGKLNKANILTKAVEYIKHLEFRTSKLEDENRSLRERIQVLDKIVARGGDAVERTSALTAQRVNEEPAMPLIQPGSSTDQSKERPKGLIEIPDSLRRMREGQPQEHYGHVYGNHTGGSRFGGKWTQRIMLGSLASLMVVEGFSESDQDSESQRKALFGIPLEILDGWTFLRSPRIYLATFAQYSRTGGVIPMIKGFIAISMLAFLIFAWMFNSKPSPRKQKEEREEEQLAIAKPAAPIHVRRRAWSTSMQTLGLPHHSFFPEWFAVTSEWINYSIRYWLGPRAALWLCGVSPEDEIARIKAWDIAIDAQLAGGDFELTRSRAVLTIIGAGTLPKTPLRLMMKAIHCRVVLWGVGVPETLSGKIATFFATYTANRQWRQARLLHEALPIRDSDRLPGYLNYLLQMDCNEVFSDTICQRAFNLMYDRPSNEHAYDALMDVVVEDHAIRSPLDAIAAWRSTAALNDALQSALQAPDAADLLREHIQTALEIAPPGSTAETRALAVHAVLSPGRRHAFYLKAADAITTRPVAQSRVIDGESVPYFIDSSTPTSARPEIAACLSCAQIMLKLEQDREVSAAVDMFSNIRWPDLGTNVAEPLLLSTATVFFVLSRLIKAARYLYATEDGQPSQLVQCTFIAQQLYKHLSAKNVASTETRQTNSANRWSSALDLLSSNFDTISLLSPSRRYSNVSHDTGYVSSEEQDLLHGDKPCLARALTSEASDTSLTLTC